MHSVSPVLTEQFVNCEHVVALDQPEYEPVIIARIPFTNGTFGMCVRFRLSDEDRKAIANGADIVVTEVTMGQSFTPISVDITPPHVNPFLVG